MVSTRLSNMYLNDPLQSKPLIEGLMANMKEGLLLLDASNQVIEANEAALKLFGFPSVGELAGMGISALYKSQAQSDALTNALMLGRVEGLEGTFLRHDGSAFEGSCSGTQICEGGSCIKMVLVRDVTALKVSEKKLAGYNKRLEKNSQALDQFAYIVSHDLKAPLRAINNLSAWIQEDAGPTLSEENKSNLTMLRGRVARLESMINGILEYSKVGRTQVAVEAVDVYGLIEEVVEMLAPSAHIRIEIGGNMPVLETQKIMLMQIFSNLISNAIKYNDKPQGIVRISCSEKGEGHQFEIEDNGPGIPSEFFEKIFIIFQTLQSRDKFESTGIGLTIVKRIIEEVNGNIWVESEIGKGSKFIFEWPSASISNDTANG